MASKMKVSEVHFESADWWSVAAMCEQIKFEEFNLRCKVGNSVRLSCIVTLDEGNFRFFLGAMGSSAAGAALADFLRSGSVEAMAFSGPSPVDDAVINVDRVARTIEASCVNLASI